MKLDFLYQSVSQRLIMINNIQPRLGILFDKLGYIACRSIHVSLVLAFIIIITALTYLGLGFIFTISLLPVKLIYLTMGLWIIYNIIFNYVMATLVSPGNPTAVVPLQLLRKIDQRCKKCYTIKPPRSHHCSMCNSCVLQMDHHCPWLGTCIGHHNRRFFINFLTYITLGLAYFMFLCWETGNFYRRLDMIAFSGSLFICLFLFGGFHWIIMLRGQTTLEVCFGDPKYKPSKNMMDNFEIVYGTKNCCLAFLPSNRILPYTNYEWSRALINCDDNENNLLSNRGHEIAT